MEILITKVKESSGWLSCMSPHPVEYDGKIYKTCEALFQALRFKDFPNIQEDIRVQKSPMVAKMVARKHKSLLKRTGSWDESQADIALMNMVLKLKLQQHPGLEAKLIATDNARIIEDCTARDRKSARFWGAVKVNGKWEGKNILGELWMEIRKELLENGYKKNKGRAAICCSFPSGVTDRAPED